MLTKTDFCKMKISEFAKANQIKLGEVKDYHVYESSTLAVCLEHMGLIKETEHREYASTRGGIIFTHWDEESQEVKVLTVRDLLEMLPD